LHHACGPVNNCEVVSEKFLRPAAYDMDRPVIIQDFLNSTAVADPVEEGAPEPTFVFRNGPSTASGFSDE
jgi:hypothetical protein